MKSNLNKDLVLPARNRAFKIYDLTCDGCNSSIFYIEDIVPSSIYNCTAIFVACFKCKAMKVPCIYTEIKSFDNIALDLGIKEVRVITIKKTDYS